jgi:uncharacterized protein (DUF4415 family)
MANQTFRGKRRRSSRRKSANANAVDEQKKRLTASLHTMKIADFYRPLKRPVTLRLDADVIAWFKKDGRRYQTRINQALRRVMESEMKKK